KTERNENLSTTTDKNITQSFLNKKRKNSDLKFIPDSKYKNTNQTSPSLNTTETKITSFFLQKKTSSHKKETVCKSGIENNNSNLTYLSQSVCKKLDFD